MNNITVVSLNLSEMHYNDCQMTQIWICYEIILRDFFFFFYLCVLLGYLLRRLVVENQLELTMTREWQFI